MFHKTSDVYLNAIGRVKWYTLWCESSLHQSIRGTHYICTSSGNYCYLPKAIYTLMDHCSMFSDVTFVITIMYCTIYHIFINSTNVKISNCPLSSVHFKGWWFPLYAERKLIMCYYYGQTMLLVRINWAVLLVAYASTTSLFSKKARWWNLQYSTPRYIVDRRTSHYGLSSTSIRLFP